MSSQKRELMAQKTTQEKRVTIQESAAYQYVRNALNLKEIDDSAAFGILGPLLEQSAGNGKSDPMSAEEAARLLSPPCLPDTTFAVVDIETTGGRPPQHRITELAAVKVRAGEVVDSCDFLVNPAREIPWNVVRLTGITDAMVADKPGLMEALPGFLDFIDGCVFVAHCATFDLHFLQYYAQEFLERDFSPPVLCTFELANRLLPRQKRFNLGELSASLGLPDTEAGRHRALSDAEATAQILVRFMQMGRLLGLESLESLLEFQQPDEGVPPPMAEGIRLDPAKIESLPRERGVFRLYDKDERLVFAGKANDIRRAVRDMFYPKNRSAGRFALRLKGVRRVEAKSLRSELAMNVEAFRAMRKASLINGNLSVAGGGFLRLSAGVARPGVSFVSRLARDGARYYGPFRKKAQLADLLEAIGAAFPLPCEAPEGNRNAKKRGGFRGGKRPPRLPDSEYTEMFEILMDILEGRIPKEDEGIFSLLNRAWGEEVLSPGKLRRRIARLHHLVKMYALSGPSVERRRLIIVEPGQTREERYCYFIKDGLLAHEISFERSDPPVGALEEKINEIFLSGDFEQAKASPEDFDEAAVFAGWMRRELMDGFMLNLEGCAPSARVMEALTGALDDPQAAGTTITL